MEIQNGVYIHFLEHIDCHEKNASVFNKIGDYTNTCKVLWSGYLSSRKWLRNIDRRCFMSGENSHEMSGKLCFQRVWLSMYRWRRILHLWV